MLLADPRCGRGPCGRVFFAQEPGWIQATLGAVRALNRLMGIRLHAPMGLIIDMTRWKRDIRTTGPDAACGCVSSSAWRAKAENDDPTRVEMQRTEAPHPAPDKKSVTAVLRVPMFDCGRVRPAQTAAFLPELRRPGSRGRGPAAGGRPEGVRARVSRPERRRARGRHPRRECCVHNSSESP